MHFVNEQRSSARRLSLAIRAILAAKSSKDSASASTVAIPVANEPLTTGAWRGNRHPCDFGHLWKYEETFSLRVWKCQRCGSMERKLKQLRFR